MPITAQILAGRQDSSDPMYPPARCCTLDAGWQERRRRGRRPSAAHAGRILTLPALLPAAAQAQLVDQRAPLDEELGGQLSKELLRRFEDPSEACRDLAVSLLTRLLQVGG